jgi:hypothetical protein
MSNWVMVLYVITAFSNHGTRIPIDSPENGLFKAYEDKATCEAALVKVEPASSASAIGRVPIRKCVCWQRAASRSDKAPVCDRAYPKLGS